MGFTRNIERDRAILGTLVNRLGLPATVLSLLEAHAEAVRASNPRLSLVSPPDVELLVPRHTADSLLFALVRRPSPGERWLDVGSGAGFPGLVLACCFPECEFLLLEPLKRRSGFLELVSAGIGLGNVTTDGRRLEELGSEAFEVAVARALSAPDEAIRSMIRLVKPGGDAIVAVGPGAKPVPGGKIVAVDDLGNVDSPGLFSMMTREG